MIAERRFAGKDPQPAGGELRRRMGYAIQSIGLFPTGRWRKISPPTTATTKVVACADNDRIDELMALLGLESALRDRLSHQLSGEDGSSGSALRGRWLPIRRYC